MKFYIDRNKNKSYSRKLNQKINKEVRLLIDFPNLGTKTDFEGIRGLIIDNFILFYEIENDKIVIHHIWDSRQNPDKLKIK